MSKKKKTIFIVITILIIIIISFIIPVKKEVEEKVYSGDNGFCIMNPKKYNVYTYKNIYGITIKTFIDY